MSDDSSSLDTLLGELQHRHRRLVLAFFDESEARTAHVDDLVEYIGNRDSDTPGPRRLAVKLHHVVLPALADAGLVDYVHEDHTVRYRENPRVARALDLLFERGDNT